MNTLARKEVFGEVFTPPIIIDELLDQFPPSIWRDSTKQWLDPCAGRGQFFIRALPRLMEGLASEFPDAKTRRHHILSQMFTMVEINPVNAKAIRRTFGPDVRVECADFLATPAPHPNPHPQNTYDVILANPPYQAPKAAAYHGSYAKRTLWDKFLVRALDISNQHAYVGFITPGNWRRPGHPLYDRITQSLTYLHIYSKHDGRTHFGVQSRFDVYLLRPASQEAPTSPPSPPLIIDEEGVRHTDVQAHTWPFLPNFAYREVRALFTTKRTPPQPVIYDASLYDSRKLHQNPSPTYKYPVVHTLTQEGIGLRYASTRDPRHFGVPKVILNFNEKQYPVNDYQSKYGMSQLSFGLPIRGRTQGDRIVACIRSPAFQRVLRATKWAAYQTDYRMFAHFRRDFCDRLHRRSRSGRHHTKASLRTTRKRRRSN